MGERWVANASPLIALASIGRLQLLAALADEVVIPEAVAREVGMAEGELKHALSASSVRTPRVEPHEVVLPWGLGAGETAVLSFARRNAGYVALLDDLAARRCASALGVPVRGTVGIVLLAKARALIPSAAGVLSELQSAGFYLSPELLALALSLAGEVTGPQ